MNEENARIAEVVNLVAGVQKHAIESVNHLLQGKLTKTTIDLGSHNMIIEVREKVTPPPLPEVIKK